MPDQDQDTQSPPSPPNAPHMTPDQFRTQGHRMVDWIADYLANVGQSPVLSQRTPGQTAAMLPDAPPANPGSQSEWDAIFQDLDSIITPGLTHWQHPRFFGYFPCNGSGPAILGEMLSAGLGIQGMLWQTSPACTELETRMLDWMAQACDLPECFHSGSPTGGGCIQGTASEAALVALVAARKRILDRNPKAKNLVVYTSNQAHSSITKAAMIAGIATNPQDNTALRMIDVDENLAMCPIALARALDQDLAAGRTPVMLALTLGTTGTTAFDSITNLAPIWKSKTQHAQTNAWIHVDAAHAGAALVCPEHRTMIQDLDACDSFCFNPHKWLLTTFDCDLFWTKDRQALTDSLSILPEYLRNSPTESGDVLDYRDWQVPLGRRFRALKLWFTIRHYGIQGLQAHIRGHIQLATWLEQRIAQDARFEITAKRTLNLVCFRLRAGDQPTKDLLERINNSGQAFLTHTTIPPDDLYTIRACIGATTTTPSDVATLWSIIDQHARELLG